MNKQEMLSEYKRQEDKICLSQVLDKIEFSKSKERIEATDFLDMYQFSLVENFLRKIKKGARVFVVATPEKFVMHNVLMKGKIIMFDKYMLFDGKVIDTSK